jgi:hypothetical protein
LRPTRARAGHLEARFGRSELYGETDSGAVCAGSNPAGGADQRPNSNSLTIAARAEAQACDLRRRGRVSISRPIRARPTSRPAANALLSGIHRYGRQAIAVAKGRCSLSSVAATHVGCWQRRHRPGAAAHSVGPGSGVERRARNGGLSRLPDSPGLGWVQRRSTCSICALIAAKTTSAWRRVAQCTTASSAYADGGLCRAGCWICWWWWRLPRARHK